jgi:UTP-glucose-1-phosphate uridylyltransferase
MTGRPVARVVVAAGGLGTRVSPWSRYLPKEFYPVDGRPGIAHLLDEIAALGPAEVVIIYHPHYETFAAWARTALSREGQDRYHQAARICDGSWPAGLTVSLVPQHGPYADITSVHNGADHLAADSDLYVAFADNLYSGDNPLLALRAAPPGHLAVLARSYQPELAASRGVIAVIRTADGQLLMHDLAEKPGPRAARALERQYGTGNLLVLEGRARLTPGFIRFARRYQAPAGTEPKLALAIAAYARTHPVIITTTTSQVIDLGTSPPGNETPGRATPGNSGIEGTSCGYDSSESTPPLATLLRCGTPTPAST